MKILSAASELDVCSCHQNLPPSAEEDIVRGLLSGLDPSIHGVGRSIFFLSSDLETLSELRLGAIAQGDLDAEFATS